ncbi:MULTISPECIES: DUF5132 domain-containing protein [unclassified Sinorhizobium]|uniref:DUF5132 domain-containing protein n=1 Tax=unclassified Sinorhizobium TaxID=2613772 RepID=UPI003524B336
MALQFLAGLAIGFGAGLLAQRVAPAVTPVAKSVIKAGLIAYDEAKIKLAELNESADDAIAEIRAEIEEERKAAGAQPQLQG